MEISVYGVIEHCCSAQHRDADSTVERRDALGQPLGAGVAHEKVSQEKRTLHRQENIFFLSCRLQSQLIGGLQ